MPLAGDARSGDAVVTVANGDILIEAETHLDDIQAIERKAAAKARDLGADPPGAAGRGYAGTTAR